MAPMYVENEEDRQAILGLKHIQAIQNMIRKASVAIVGVGEVSAECTLARSGPQRFRCRQPDERGGGGGHYRQLYRSKWAPSGY